jgi:predicted small metal-binding protein
MTGGTEVATKRYVCLEAGCELSIEADDDDALVEAVETHMAEAHNTFELEDVILANAVVVGGAE